MELIVSAKSQIPGTALSNQILGIDERSSCTGFPTFEITLSWLLGIIVSRVASLSISLLELEALFPERQFLDCEAVAANLSQNGMTSHSLPMILLAQTQTFIVDPDFTQRTSSTNHHNNDNTDHFHITLHRLPLRLIPIACSPWC